jgi:hypothetical protein
VRSWLKRRDSDDPWSGRQPRYERLVSDGAGRFFIVARLPSGEPVRRRLGRFSMDVRPLSAPRSSGPLARLHNPGGHRCGCVPECWCKRSLLGYAVRWYVPARWHRVGPPAQS